MEKTDAFAITSLAKGYPHSRRNALRAIQAQASRARSRAVPGPSGLRPFWDGPSCWDD